MFITNFIHYDKGFLAIVGELESDFCKNLTEFYQISLKNLPHLTDFSPQLMANMLMIAGKGCRCVCGGGGGEEFF